MDPIVTVILTPADVLDVAADYITAYGLHKGEFFDVEALSLGDIHAPACTLGAINLVTRHTTISTLDVRDVLKVYLTGRYPCLCVLDGWLDCTCGGAPLISQWNDDPDRTADEVSVTLHNAAEAWRAAQSGGAA